MDTITNAVVKADEVIKQITSITDDCLRSIEKMQTFVKMSRDAIIGKDDEISLYKLFESVKEIRNKDISIALVEHTFDTLKVIVGKLRSNSNNNNNNATYDSIYNELKSNAEKYDTSITSTNIFKSIEIYRNLLKSIEIY